MKNSLGLYIHTPFCKSKCPYCDFYSFRGSAEDRKIYADSVIDEIKTLSRTGGFLKNREKIDFDTVYLGGGTPSLLGADAGRIIGTAEKYLNVSDDAEITVEINPSSSSDEFFDSIKGKVNRVSIGLQSAVDSERKKLGRISGKKDAAETIKKSKEAGIENISLDIMIGVPCQTFASLDETADFCLSSGVTHISAYMLTLEEGTPFYNMKNNLHLPDEDETADMYLHLVDKLNKNGFKQYEISNFSVPGFESRHNLKYWNDEEYLGIGPSAHSFVDGTRFSFPRDLKYFIDGGKPEIYDTGGDKAEYAMLRLRLSDGLRNDLFSEKFGENIPSGAFETAKKWEKTGHVEQDGERISLTPKGFLISNIIIEDITEAVGQI